MKQYLIFDIGGTFVKWALIKQDYKITYLTLHQMEKISKEGLEEKSMAYMEKVLPKMADWYSTRLSWY